MSVLTHFTAEQYEKMGAAGVFDGISRQRVELIRGEIRQMTPVGNRHRTAVIDVTDWSYDVVDRGDVLISVQAPIHIPNLECVPEPDVAWVKRKRVYPEPSDVFLLIEIADSSLEFDLGEKRDIYAAAGIAEYWVINLIDQAVEVFRQPLEGEYRLHQTHRGNEEIRPAAFPHAVFRLADLFES